MGRGEAKKAGATGIMGLRSRVPDKQRSRQLSHAVLVAQSEVANEPGVMAGEAIRSEFDYGSENSYLIPDFYKVWFIDDDGKSPVTYREDIYIGEDADFRLQTGPNPIAHGAMALPNEFNAQGAWIGPDRLMQFKRVTVGVRAAIQPSDIQHLFDRYNRQDYGEGEAGFAVYTVRTHRLYMIDDAVRSPEGLPPNREVNKSPGPLTLMLPSEY